MADLDIYKKLNPSIYIEERDLSVYQITQFYNQITLVIGCSKSGPFNVPVINISPDNFDKIYGPTDYSLERKGSYFHRTVKNMLQEGPVLSLNLRLTDPDLDQYNWISFSTSSDNLNSVSRSNSVSKFFNTSDGFWKRSSDQVIELAHDILPDAKRTPLHFINQGSKPISILIFKSQVSGFDVPMEDWYNSGSIPSYVHPKDLVSDYLVDVYAIQGRWNNYDQLATHPKWNKYFSKTGVRRENFLNFLNESEVILEKKWTASLIPYFKDKANRDLFITNIINADVDETGLWVSYDVDAVENDYRAGLIDLLGDNLSAKPKPRLDFLSYKRNLTDLLLVHEALLDQPGNSFGNADFILGGREQYYTEGYIYGCKLKNLIINTSNTYTVHAVECFDDSAYAVLNGKLINLGNKPSNFSYVISLPHILSPNHQVGLIIVLTEQGIDYRLTRTFSIDLNLPLPAIDYNREIVLGYYKIWQTSDLLFHSQLFPVTLDTNGYVNPFRINNDTDARIQVNNTNYIWQQDLHFEKIQIINSQDYAQQRIYHLWNWLSTNLKEKESLYIDIHGEKELIDRVEQFNEGEGKTIRISIVDRESNIQDVDGTNGMISLYMNDYEFIAKQEQKWKEMIQPYQQGSNGVIGDDSYLYDSYLNGQINSGDPFFKSLGEETNVLFTTDNIQNYLVLQDGPNYNYVGRKIIIYGTTHNDGIYHVLNYTYLNGEYALYLKENITLEEVSVIYLFDAENPQVMNLMLSNGKMKAEITPYQGDAEELYERIFSKDPSSQWEKTLEIEEVLDLTHILVDVKRYGHILKKNNYLLTNPKLFTNEINEMPRKWTRIIDVVRWANDESLLLVVTDGPILIDELDGDLRTQHLIPIDSWVDTLDFKVLEPYIVRPESLPDGTEKRQNDILNLLNKTKLMKALCTDKMEWRYLIDSFGLGLTQNSKFQLAALCELKGQALGFLNMPSIKQFTNSSDVSFTSDGVIDTGLMLSGGNRYNSNSIQFSTTNVGKSYVCYLTPYVIINERGRYFEIPPSSYVAQMYMKKHNDNKSFLPWTIIAGTKYRLYNISGLEYTFTPEQLNDLHLMRITPITSYQNTIFYLFNENTSELSNSALGYIHNREALIELELTLKQELNNFQWSFYNEETINMIVSKANEICEYYKKAIGLADYSNYFDNSPDLIDAQLAVLNTYIEPVAGMGSIVLRININRTSSTE